MNKLHVLVFLSLLACRRPSATEPLALPSEPLAQLEQGLSYPQGAFWYDPVELSRVRLAARHILVSHDQVGGSKPLLGAVVQPVSRSREQALRRAVAIARLAAATPESFAELASTYSDDRSSAQVGGGLGTFSPVSVPRPMVDALGALSEGAVSHVFESELGFQIVQRVAVAARQRLSFSRILVAYGDAHGVDSKTQGRSREQALQRVAQLSAELTASPKRFAELARTQSDADDASRAGDAGAFDLYELGAPALLLHVAGSLALHQPSAPVETQAGFVILVRTPERSRLRYSLTELTIPHVAAKIKLLGATATETEARQQGAAILAALASGTSFEAVLTELCRAPSCQARTRSDWQGRGAPELERALFSLAPGQVLQQLAPSAVGYHVVRREVDPEQTYEHESVRFDLPAGPTLEALIARAEAAELAAATRRLGREAVAALQIAEPGTVGLFDQLAAGFEREQPDARQNLLVETRMKLRELLGEQKAARIALYVRQGLRQPITSGSAPVPQRAPL